MSIGDFLPHVPRLQQYLREAGREPANFPIRGSIVAGDNGPDAWIATARRYRDAGVTHITLGVPPGLSPSQTLDRLRDARSVLAAASV